MFTWNCVIYMDKTQGRRETVHYVVTCTGDITGLPSNDNKLVSSGLFLVREETRTLDEGVPRLTSEFGSGKNSILISLLQ